MSRILPFVLLAFAAWAQKPPATRIDSVKEVLHGVEIADPYRWLEDQQSPEARAWIDAQNAYSRPILDRLPARARLGKRLAELMNVEETSVPRAAAAATFSRAAASVRISPFCA